MTAEKPPPYPADTRAKGWRFELNMEQVKKSDTWLRARTGRVRASLLLLWAEAWEQTPCGSLPNDDELLCLLLDMEPDEFAAARPVLMRGWWEAEDGRLYHDTISERVLQMLDTRGTDRARQDARQKQFETVRTRDGRACVYCGHSKYLTLDHLLPLSRGGDNDERNLAMACRPCNSKKGARTPDEAGMQLSNSNTADRWRGYMEERGDTTFSGGEKRSAAGSFGATQRNSTRTSTGSKEEEQKTARKRAAPPPIRPDSVSEQVWVDWLALRKAKRAPVTATVVEDATTEAAKAGMGLDAFLRVWCRRGSQGLEADWLKPHERGTTAFDAKAAEAAKWTRGTSLDRSTQQDYIDAAAPAIR